MSDLKLLVQQSKLSPEDILSQVDREYQRWLSFVVSKREKFEKDLRLYNNQKKNKNKIWDTTVYNVHTALMARLYMGQTEVVFEWTKVWQEYIADNLNAAYKEDFENEAMAQVKYQRYWDTLFYWVGIVAKTWWDWSWKSTVFQNVDPRLWIPDPDWNYVSNDYSFTGFEKLVSPSELKALWLYNEDLAKNTGWYEQADSYQRSDEFRSWLTPDYSISWVDNAWYNIYYHFSTFNWVKALVITWNNNKLILDVKLLKPVLETEKKNNNKIPFPFSFTYYRPERNNPFGKSVVDDTWDVQEIKAQIANLRLDKSRAELYPMYLYNTRLIKNRSDLDFGFNKMIWVNPLEWEPLNNAITPIQKDFRADNSYLIEQSLDAQVEKATSIWAIAQGSETRRRETATTNKLTQSNTDINLNLTSRIISWWEKTIAELWYRWILEHFESWDVKNIKMYNGMSYTPVQLRKKDLVSKDELRISVKNSLEITEKRQKEIQAFNMALPILQSLQLPEVSTNYLYRDFLRNLWYDEKKIWVAIPQTPEEIKITEDIKLLQAGISVMPDDNIDVQTALILLKQCDDTPNVLAYKLALMDMYTNQQEEAKKMEQQQGQQWWQNPQDQMQNSLKNNIVNQAGSSLQNMAQSFNW